MGHISDKTLNSETTIKHLSNMSGYDLALLSSADCAACSALLAAASDADTTDCAALLSVASDGDFVVSSALLAAGSESVVFCDDAELLEMSSMSGAPSRR